MMPLIQKLVRFTLLLALCTGCALAVQAATAIKEYAARIEAASQRVQSLIEEEATDTEIARAMIDLNRLFPAHEEVTTNSAQASGQTIRVDNSWLQAATGQVMKNAGGDAEQRRHLLVVLNDQLAALRARIEPILTPPVAASGDQAKLQEILARPEYAPQLQQDSSLKRWWRDFWRWVDRQLSRLLRGRGGSVAPGQISTAATLVRLLLIAALAGTVVYAVVKLVRRRQRRRTDDEASDVREVLGERIDEDATSVDLLADAREMAGRGDYRAAIRRTYIALLVELEGRGKLKLQRAKTNRDYLDAVKTKEASATDPSADRLVYPAFATMTGTFEHVWYGQEHPGEAQFNDYLTEYQETVNQ